MDQPNDLIDNRYELGEPIGRGGMATIHKATDVRMHVEVAIKILREVYSTDPKFVTRFQREARAARALEHPNIVRVYDYGQSGDAYYIVMELVNGSDLRRYLKQRQGVLPPDHAVEIAHDVALGLGAAHRRGIVHRDVKPQNVLINDDGLVKLTDFGIASVYKDGDAERLTTTGMTLGTVQYYAPEQAQGEIVTPAADVYALGIVMYEMLTGKTPFDGDTPVAVAMRHIQDIPEPPSHLNPAIPRELERIILRCLEKDPRDRYPNGDALAYALDQYVRRPQNRFGASSTGIRPLGLPGIDGRSQTGRNPTSQTGRNPSPQTGRNPSLYGASAVISGPRRGAPPPVGDGAFDAPTYDDFGEPMNGVSTTPWESARGTLESGAVYGGDHNKGRKRNTGLIAAMIGGLVLLLGLACVLVIVIGNSVLNGGNTSTAKYTTVPQFIGKQYLEAQALAQQNHLKVSETQISSDKPAGQVLDQDTPSGQRVKWDVTINLTVSGGLGTVLVPDVTGMTLKDACTALEKVNLHCAVVAYQASTITSGNVISSDP
ncbi:MAG TPA: Stk1 family PASTA domain-containing Ser/Thr kinase, partial [Ktedonobacterales bacterium]|nr:Stk1 family PASTA domain-containing Ser/Thr kinase [Ktedonobacterales bacterium]